MSKLVLSRRSHRRPIISDTWYGNFSFCKMNEIYFIIERAVCSSSIQQYKQNYTSTKSKAYDVPVQIYETKRKIYIKIVTLIK
jgi:hypothetical protein